MHQKDTKEDEEKQKAIRNTVIKYIQKHHLFLLAYHEVSSETYYINKKNNGKWLPISPLFCDMDNSDKKLFITNLL